MGELALLIPILIFSIPIVAIWTSHQRKMAELRQNDAPEISAQQTSHTQELEDRVRVLERIITDRGFDVATQIEALRDRPRAEALIDRRDRETLP